MHVVVFGKRATTQESLAKRVGECTEKEDQRTQVGRVTYQGGTDTKTVKSGDEPMAANQLDNP